MRHFYLLVAFFTLFTAAMAFPMISYQQAAAAQAARALLENNSALTNSERIARGLPVKQPDRYYDASRTRGQYTLLNVSIIDVRWSLNSLLVLNPRASARRKREDI